MIRSPFDLDEGLSTPAQPLSTETDNMPINSTNTKTMSMASSHTKTALLIERLTAENNDLVQTLQQRDQECQKAALIGQDLLEKVQLLQAELDRAKTLQKDLSNNSTAAKKELTDQNVFSYTPDKHEGTIANDSTTNPSTPCRPKPPQTPRPPFTPNNQNLNIGSSSTFHTPSTLAFFPRKPAPRSARRVVVPPPSNSTSQKQASPPNSPSGNTSHQQHQNLDLVPSSPGLDMAFAAKLDETLLLQARSLQQKLIVAESSKRELEEKYKESETKCEELKKRVEKSKQDHAKLSSALYESELQTTSQSQKIQELESSLHRAESQIRSLATKNSSFQEQYEHAKSQEQSLLDRVEKNRLRYDGEIRELRRINRTLVQEKDDLKKRVEELETLQRIRPLGGSLSGLSLASALASNNSSASLVSNRMAGGSENASFTASDSLVKFSHTTGYGVEGTGGSDIVQGNETERSTMELNALLKEAYEMIEDLQQQAKMNASHSLLPALGNAGGETVENIFKPRVFDGETQTEVMIYTEMGTGTSEDDMVKFKDAETSAVCDVAEEGAQTVLTSHDIDVMLGVVEAEVNGVNDDDGEEEDDDTEGVDEDGFEELTAEEVKPADSLNIGDLNWEISEGIQCLTRTMIGSWFYKFDRLGRRPHLRFFWIHPYSMTINWGDKEPSQQSSRVKYKSAYIQSFSLQTKPLSQAFSRLGVPFVIHTPRRSLKLVPASKEDHTIWLRGLTTLLEKAKENTLAERIQVVDLRDDGLVIHPTPVLEDDESMTEKESEAVELIENVTDNNSLINDNDSISIIVDGSEGVEKGVEEEVESVDQFQKHAVARKTSFSGNALKKLFGKRAG